MGKLGIYCRISRIKDGNDLSIEDQKQKGISKANELSIPYNVYIDEGLSGASDKIEDRPEFEKFLQDVASGELTHVFAFDQSRFERNPQIRFVILDLFKKNNITYYTHMDGEVNLHDPQSEFFGDLLSVINKFHVTTTKLKVKSAVKVRAKEGKSHGVLPFGYTTDESGTIIIDADEAVIVRRIYELSYKGIGTRTIAEMFNEEGIQTRSQKFEGEKKDVTTYNKYTGKPRTKKRSDITWSPTTIYWILKNPFYKGERHFGGEVYTNVPAIFDSEYWDMVNANVSENKNNSGKKVEHRYLLKGLLRCGICGRNLYGKKREDKSDNFYMCSSKRIKGANCGNRSINIDRIENFVWMHLFQNGELSKAIEKEFQFDDVEVKRLSSINKNNQTKIDKLLGERKNAIDLTIKGILSSDDIGSNLERIDREVNELKTINDSNELKIKALESSNEIVDKYKSIFDKLTDTASFDQKQKILKDFIYNIVVTYNESSSDYLIDIQYKVDIPNNTVLSKMKKKESEYKFLDSNENELFALNIPLVEHKRLYHHDLDNEDNSVDSIPNHIYDLLFDIEANYSAIYNYPFINDEDFEHRYFEIDYFENKPNIPKFLKVCESSYGKEHIDELKDYLDKGKIQRLKDADDFEVNENGFKVKKKKDDDNSNGGGSFGDLFDPRNVTGNIRLNKQSGGGIIAPLNVTGIECFISWRWELPSARRNFFSS